MLPELAPRPRAQLFYWLLDENAEPRAAKHKLCPNNSGDIRSSQGFLGPPLDLPTASGPALQTSPIHCCSAVEKVC